MDFFSILVLISSFYACLSILKIIFFFRPSLFMGIQHCLCLLDLSLHLFNVIFEKKSRCRYLSIRFFTFIGIHRLEKIRHMTKCLLTAESFELRKRVNLAVCRPRLTWLGVYWFLQIKFKLIINQPCCAYTLWSPCFVGDHSTCVTFRAYSRPREWFFYQNSALDTNNAYVNLRFKKLIPYSHTLSKSMHVINVRPFKIVRRIFPYCYRNIYR